MAAQCLDCGTRLPAGGFYCNRCMGNQTTSSRKYARPISEHDEYRALKWIGTVILVLALIVGAYLWWYMSLFSS